MKAVTSPNVLTKEKVSPGGIKAPLIREAARLILKILDSIECWKREVPVPISSFIPKELTFSVVISGSVTTTGVLTSAFLRFPADIREAVLALIDLSRFSRSIEMPFWESLKVTTLPFSNEKAASIGSFSTDLKNDSSFL